MRDHHGPRVFFQGFFGRGRKLGVAQYAAFLESHVARIRVFVVVVVFYARGKLVVYCLRTLSACNLYIGYIIFIVRILDLLCYAFFYLSEGALEVALA